MVDSFDSGVVAFMNELGGFTKAATADIIMPTRVQKGDGERLFRTADVYLMRLPDSKSATKKAPYILHQLITCKDQQTHGQRPKAVATVRSIFTVYNEDEQEGGWMLLNLVERVRIASLKAVSIGRRFRIDLDAGLEFTVYPEDTAPYYAGEMFTQWEIPSIEREVRQLL